MERRVEAASPAAVRAAGEVIAHDMRSNAPRRTGRLAAGISVEVESFGDGATAKISSDVPYDRFVQRGTVYMEPQAYGEEAARSGEDAVVDVMARVYRAALPR